MKENLYDVIIVGAGPAGLSAAIYMARAKYRVLVLEKSGIGGQITITSEIVNYPGVEMASGKELTEKMRIQAESFGAEFAIGEVIDMELSSDIKLLHTTKGDYEALGVILAPGANPRKLGFTGEKEFQGRGVAYCATCDGEFFTGKEVFVIGGGFAAVEESMFLTKYASKVTIIVRESEFTCAKTVSDQLENYEKINVIFETEIIEAGGSNTLEYAKFRNNATGEEWEYRVNEQDSFGIFIFAGYVPNTGWIGNNIELDRQGYIITDINQKTNINGVYAAGDVCVKNLRQVVTAVSDGAVAATSLERNVSELHEKLKIPELYKKKDKEDKGKKVYESEGQDSGSAGENKFIGSEIRAQLDGVFGKFSRKAVIRAWLDDSNLSAEIKGFLGEITEVTDKIEWKAADADISLEQGKEKIDYPAMELLYEDGSSSGIFFHGVPGGHEFNSFIIALYNVAGPGQEITDEVKAAVENIKENVNIKVLVSLSCTMCPDVVMSSQRIAALSPYVTAEMYDISHFPEMKKKYNVMSVPCMVINNDKIVFGKKNIAEVLQIISEQGKSNI